MKKTICGGKDGWDPSRYLNIWVCDLTNSQSNGMTLGYAYLPGLLADFNSSNDYKDGLVVDYIGGLEVQELQQLNQMEEQQLMKLDII